MWPETTIMRQKNVLMEHTGPRARLTSTNAQLQHIFTSLTGAHERLQKQEHLATSQLPLGSLLWSSIS